MTQPNDVPSGARCTWCARLLPKESAGLTCRCGGKIVPWDVSEPLPSPMPILGENGERLPEVRVQPILPVADCPIITPICATCGHEIDKNALGWFHVAGVVGHDPGDARDDAAVQAMDADFQEFPHDE